MTAEDKPGERTCAGGSKRRPRVRWRRLLGWAALPFVVAVVVLVSSPYWLPTGWLRVRLEQELSEALDVQATVGALSFRVGRGVRVRLTDVKLVSEVRGTRLQLSLDSLEGEALLEPLLAGRLRAPEVALESVRCRLEMGPEGLKPLLERWGKQAERRRREQALARGPAEKGPRTSPFQMKRILLNDLVFTLVASAGSKTSPTGGEHTGIRHTPKLNAAITVSSLKPMDIKFEAEGDGFITQGRLYDDPGPAGGARGSLRVRNVDLKSISDCLGLLLDSDALVLTGLLREGTANFAVTKDETTVKAAATVEHLKAQVGADPLIRVARPVGEVSDPGCFATTRLQMQGVRMAARRTDKGLELDLGSFPIETGVFDIRFPLAAAGAKPFALNLSGRRLSGSFAGSARYSSAGGLSATLHTTQPLRVLEAHLRDDPEAEPLLSVGQAELSGAEARVEWTETGLTPLTVTGTLDFERLAPTGLLAAPPVGEVFGPPVSVALEPLSGTLTVDGEGGVLQGTVKFGSAGLSFEERGVSGECGRWQADADFAVVPQEGRLELASARWSCPSVQLSGRAWPRGAGVGPALLATLAGVRLEGSLSAEPTPVAPTTGTGSSPAAPRGWSLTGSGKGVLGPLSLQSDGQHAAQLGTLSFSGSAEAVVGGADAGLTALRAQAEALGVRAPESLAHLLPGWPEEAGLRLSGKAHGSVQYVDGRWQASASAAGKEVRLTWTDERGPVTVSLDGLRASIEAGVPAGGSGVSVRRCRVDSPLGRVSWHGFVRLADGKPRLQVAGSLASTWKALAPPWRALLERLPGKLGDTLSRFDFEGPVSLEDVAVSGPLTELTLEGRVNLDDSAVRFDGELLKPAGESGRMPIRLTLEERVRLEELALELGALPRLRVAGDLDRALTEGRLEMTVEDLDQVVWKEVRPELAHLALTGGLSVETFLEDLRQNPTARARFHFDHLTLGLAGTQPVRAEIDGTVSVTPAEVAGDDLWVTVDGNRLHLSFQLTGWLKLLRRVQARASGAGLVPGLMPQLTCDVKAGTLDLTGLEQLFSGPPPEGSPPMVVELTPTSDLAAARPRVIPQVALQSQATEAWLSRWLPLVASELSGSGTVEVAEVHTSALTARDIQAAWRLRDGAVHLEVCRAGVAGGQFDAAGTRVSLDRWPVSYSLVYQATGLEPTPSTAALISQRFPGLSFSGRMTDAAAVDGVFSLDRQTRLESLSGRTHTELTEGTLVGPLPVPDHIRGLFPQLNLSTYHFSKMTNETTIERGVFHNKMTFEGATHIYIDGTTDAQGNINYELGLSLARTMTVGVTPDVARVPLMEFTGRIVGTEFVDRQGSYISPPELVVKLVADGLYKGLKKGVLDLGYLRKLQEKVSIPGLDLLIGGLDFFLDVTIRLIPGLGKEKPETGR